MKRATAADVARAAGVSRTTVSYVLNKTPHQQIPDATQRRVLEAAERLSYSPSAAARALVRGRSDVILFVFPAEVTLADWGRRVLSQMSRRFAQEGFTLLAHTGRFGRERIDDVWRSIVPAAVLCITVEPEQVRAMRAAGVPLVLPLYGGGDDIQAIAMDSERVVVTLQLQTLLDAGHERIAFASLDSAHRLTTASRQLLLPEVAASLGIEQPPHHVFPEDPEAVAAQLRALVSAGLHRHLRDQRPRRGSRAGRCPAGRARGAGRARSHRGRGPGAVRADRAGTDHGRQRYRSAWRRPWSRS